LILNENERPIDQLVTPALAKQIAEQTIQEQGSSIDKAKELEIKAQELQLEQQRLSQIQQQNARENQLEQQKLEQEKVKIKYGTYREQNEPIPEEEFRPTPPITEDSERQSGLKEIFDEATARGANANQQARIMAAVTFAKQAQAANPENSQRIAQQLTDDIEKILSESERPNNEPLPEQRPTPSPTGISQAT